jgi:hypothetical protein
MIETKEEFPLSKEWVQFDKIDPDSNFVHLDIAAIAPSFDDQNELWFIKMIFGGTT